MLELHVNCRGDRAVATTFWMNALSFIIANTLPGKGRVFRLTLILPESVYSH